MRGLLGLTAVACLLATPADAKRHSAQAALERHQHAVGHKRAGRYYKHKKSYRRASKKPYVLIAALPPKTVIDVGNPLLPLDFIGPKTPVDEYLCEVYERMPVKKDSAGDFTWKDKEAARRAKMDVCQYAIGGMHPDLRQALFHIGQKADDKGIPWSFLSGYRGEYRQRIAAGLKASPCGSMHSDRQCQERGYGRGKAADLWTYGPDGGPGSSPNPLFSLIDNIGRAFGISRPMKGYDPAHVQLFHQEQGLRRYAKKKPNKKS